MCAMTVHRSPEALAADYPIIRTAGALGDAFVVEGDDGSGGAEVGSAAGVIAVTVSLGFAVGAGYVARERGEVSARSRGGKVSAGSRGGGGGGEGWARRGEGYAGGPARARVAPVPDPRGSFMRVHFFYILYVLREGGMRVT